MKKAVESGAGGGHISERLARSSGRFEHTHRPSGTPALTRLLFCPANP
jgi:hypothetical protein